LTPVEAIIASINADDALDTALDFKSDLMRARENVPSDFTPAERAALDLLIVSAVARVKIAKIRAGLAIEGEQ